MSRKLFFDTNEKQYYLNIIAYNYHHKGHPDYDLC